MSGFLSPYRVLDLSDERGILAGYMLARLGADVVQLEGIKGSSARCVGPFDPAAKPPDNSFFWSAYASGKRSLACDLLSEEGKALVHRLLAVSDFLIESAEPGVMSSLGLGAEHTREINPSLIHVSITAFGSTGPKSGYAATDLTVWAAGGPLRLTRDSDKPPLRFSVGQSFLNAAADAASAAMIAHFSRVETGFGQHVDVSAQQSVTLCTLAASLSAAYRHDGFTLGAVSGTTLSKKQLDLSGSGARTRRSKWQVRDGLVEMHLGMGPGSGRFTNNLFKLMGEQKACPAQFAEWDWVALPQRIVDGEISDDDLERAREYVSAFLMRFSKQEVLEKALQHRFLCAPVATTHDLLNSRQLASREFFTTVVERSGQARTLPGVFAQGANTGFAAIRPAPAIGEHSDQILEEWLGLDSDSLLKIRSQGVIV